MIPDYCNALIGYRVWNVYNSGLITGQAHGDPWPPYEAMVGRCANMNGAGHIDQDEWKAAPVMDCTCGIYAFKDRTNAQYRSAFDVHPGNAFNGFFSGKGYHEGQVWGSVSLWGRIIEHEIGYRAQFAYPLDLVCNVKHLVALVSRRYGVPCRHEAPQTIPVEEDNFWFLPTLRGGKSGGGKSMVFPPISALQSYISQSYPMMPAPAPAPSAIIAPTLLRSASLAQIKAIGAMPHQRAQAQMQADKARATLLNYGDWRTLWRRGFYLTKKGTPING